MSEQQTHPNCAACGKPLFIENALITDWCPCKTRRVRSDVVRKQGRGRGKRAQGNPRRHRKA